MNSAFAGAVLKSYTIPQGVVLQEEALVGSGEDMSSVKRCPGVKILNLRYYAHPVSFSNLLSELIGSTGAGVRLSSESWRFVRDRDMTCFTFSDCMAA